MTVLKLYEAVLHAYFIAKSQVYQGLTFRRHFWQQCDQLRAQQYRGHVCHVPVYVRDCNPLKRRMRETRKTCNCVQGLLG